MFQPKPPPEPASPPEWIEPPTGKASKNYGAVADLETDFYQMLHIEPHSRIEQIEETIQLAQRWWNGQQANPKYRNKSREALARLREARHILFDPMRRQSYDRQIQATRQQWRQLRWQPVHELMDVLLTGDSCSREQEQLLIRFALRRNLTEEEIRILLNEEYLRRNVEPELEPESDTTTPKPTSFWYTLGYRFVGFSLAVAMFGILWLSVQTQTTPAILLMVPWLNDIRLLVRGLYLKPPAPHEKKASVNGWDWLAGIAVLGGSTGTALVALQHRPLFPLGVVVSSLIWFSWLLLIGLWHRHSRHDHETQASPQKTLYNTAP